jgi:Fic family protein
MKERLKPSIRCVIIITQISDRKEITAMLFRTPTLTVSQRRACERLDVMRLRLQRYLSEPRRWEGSLRRLSFARAVQGSNSIEGYNASLEDAVAVVEGEQPLDVDEETAAALRGYQNAMTYILQLATDAQFSYSDQLIKSLHFMMLSYDLSKWPGRWRPGVIYVRTERGDTVYEGPDAELIPDLMNEFVAELNASDDVPVVIRAAMAHLNFVMVHPFRDGNGRMARAVQTLVLTREGILSPAFCSVEEYLGRNNAAYYSILSRVGRGSWQPAQDATDWITFLLIAHLRQAHTLLRRVKESERLWDILSFEIELYSLPERTLYALFDAALGLKVRNSTYRTAVIDIVEQTASRDLRALVEAGYLTPVGEKRGRFYVATEKLKRLRRIAREGYESTERILLGPA